MYTPDKIFLEKRVKFRVFLLNVYGIGRFRRFVVLREFGVLSPIKMGVVLGLFYKKLVRFLDENYITERGLCRISSTNLRRERRLKSIRGWRLVNGLPVNGQTSRPNGATAKRLRLDYHCLTRKERKFIKNNEFLQGPDRRKRLRKALKKMALTNKRKKNKLNPKKNIKKKK